VPYSERGVTFQVIQVVSQTIIAISVVACVTALGLNGTLDAAAVTGVLGAVVGIAGATSATRVGGQIAKDSNGSTDVH